MKIKHQQQIAAEILDKISLVDPHCILAGGAQALRLKELL